MAWYDILLKYTPFAFSASYGMQGIGRSQAESEGDQVGVYYFKRWRVGVSYSCWSKSSLVDYLGETLGYQFFIMVEHTGSQVCSGIDRRLRRVHRLDLERETIRR